MSDPVHVKRIIAIDIETTSLDTETTDILEVGLMLLDDNFEELERQNVVFALEETMVESMPLFVREMHETSGLFEACREHGLGREAATERVAEILREWTDGLQRGEFVIAGSGVLHFDIELIARDWSDFYESLPYWFGFDIAYVRRFDEQATASRRSVLNDGKTHRAMDDLECHVAEMRLYRELLRGLS